MRSAGRGSDRIDHGGGGDQYSSSGWSSAVAASGAESADAPGGHLHYRGSSTASNSGQQQGPPPASSSWQQTRGGGQGIGSRGPVVHAYSGRPAGLMESFGSRGAELGVGGPYRSSPTYQSRGRSRGRGDITSSYSTNRGGSSSSSSNAYASSRLQWQYGGDARQTYGAGAAAGHNLPHGVTLAGGFEPSVHDLCDAAAAGVTVNPHLKRLTDAILEDAAGRLDLQRSLMVIDEISKHGPNGTINGIQLLASIKARLTGPRNATRMMLSLELIEMCVKNCGVAFARSIDDTFMKAMMKLLKMTQFKERNMAGQVNKALQKFLAGDNVHSHPTDPRIHTMRSKVLFLIQLWADSFMLQQEEVYPIHQAYRMLRRQGVKFPMRDPRNKYLVKNAEESPAFDLGMQRTYASQMDSHVQQQSYSSASTPAASTRPSPTSRQAPPSGDGSTASLTPAQMLKLRRAVETFKNPRASRVEMETALSVARQHRQSLRGYVASLASVPSDAQESEVLADVLAMSDDIDRVLASYEPNASAMSFASSSRRKTGTPQRPSPQSDDPFSGSPGLVVDRTRRDIADDEGGVPFHTTLDEVNVARPRESNSFADDVGRRSAGRDASSHVKGDQDEDRARHHQNRRSICSRNSDERIAPLAPPTGGSRKQTVGLLDNNGTAGGDAERSESFDLLADLPAEPAISANVDASSLFIPPAANISSPKMVDEFAHLTAGNTISGHQQGSYSEDPFQHLFKDVAAMTPPTTDERGSSNSTCAAPLYATTDHQPAEAATVIAGGSERHPVEGAQYGNFHALPPSGPNDLTITTADPFAAGDGKTARGGDLPSTTEDPQTLLSSLQDANRVGGGITSFQASGGERGEAHEDEEDDEGTFRGLGSVWDDEAFANLNIGDDDDDDDDDNNDDDGDADRDDAGGSGDYRLSPQEIKNLTGRDPAAAGGGESLFMPFESTSAAAAAPDSLSSTSAATNPVPGWNDDGDRGCNDNEKKFDERYNLGIGQYHYSEGNKFRMDGTPQAPTGQELLFTKGDVLSPAVIPSPPSESSLYVDVPSPRRGSDGRKAALSSSPPSSTAFQNSASPSPSNQVALTVDPRTLSVISSSSSPDNNSRRSQTLVERVPPTSQSAAATEAPRSGGGSNSPERQTKDPLGDLWSNFSQKGSLL